MGLIGPNGAGKTTLLNCLTGFIRPDHGSIRFKGTELFGYPPHRIASLGIARTFQSLHLIRQMSVLDNVLLAFRDQTGEGLYNLLFRRPVSRRQESANGMRATELLAQVDLADQAQDPAGALSYGQQKLLSLSCCLAADAQLLLLDEPVAGIAPHMAERILSLIRTLPEQGRSVILIEHDMDAISEVCQRVIVMDAGAKVSEASPEMIRNDVRVIAAYLE